MYYYFVTHPVWKQHGTTKKKLKKIKNLCQANSYFLSIFLIGSREKKIKIIEINLIQA